MAIALPSFGQKAFQAERRPFRIRMGRQHQIGCVRYRGCEQASVNHPAEYTGSAHYLEHVMFKGTDKIGASTGSSNHFPKII